jgi:uncharacterized protein YndB with AHSA1/START domain
VYRIYIHCPPQKVWDAITQPEWTEKYGYGGRGVYELKPGGSYKGYTSQGMRDAGQKGGFAVPEIGIEGEVVEAVAPKKLVLKWHMAMDEATASDAVTLLTYELEEPTPGVTKLTVVHDLKGAPNAAGILAGNWESQGAGGGWSWMLSDMKTLLETGRSFRP